ncbi:MAG: hypothetical protein IKB99_06370 [Lentisphaeria bacterium]|nr:hypothetical protein [Lentisphaeria bacterium]
MDIAAGIKRSIYALQCRLSSLAALKHIKADKWSVVGGNYVLSGKVSVKYKDFVLSCDRAVINPALGDLEARGNCRLLRWKVTSMTIPVKKLAELEKRNDIIVTVEGVTGDIFGERRLAVRAEYIYESVSAQTIVGNTKSGYFRFEQPRVKTSSIVCRADSGERLPDGVLELTNGEVSSCSYLTSDNAHYSFGAHKIRLTPHKTGLYGSKNMDRDFDDHTITMVHGIVKVYGLPVFYLPVVWKPRDEDPGIFGLKIGKNGDFGYFFSAYKRFVFSEYPLSKVKVVLDGYSERGIGGGASGTFATENSTTEFFVYTIYDTDPYGSENYDDYRIDVPHERFNFRLTNLSHITPRLDFRGVVDYSSDPYFLRDFYYGKFTSDPEPATYFSLEHQFDHLSAALYFRPQLMRTYTTVEKMPEFTLLGQRQQILNTPLYYQGDLKAGYYEMKWIEFDKKIKGDPGSKLHDYEAFRLDTTHFLYLPLRTPYFTLTPRAGFKLTAYSRTSDTDVTEDDLVNMFNAAATTNLKKRKFQNYDDDGGSKVRLAGELGFELSTKVHNTWANVRSSLLRLDGLRHVMRPYVNYTFVSKPTLAKEKIYYFDEVDRIEKQSFFRLGVENRLQTRAGNSLRDWFRMENFIDLYTSSDENVSQLGDFCTILAWTPIKGLSLSTRLLIDTGGNNEELPARYRDADGYSGIDLKWINSWDVSLKYSPVRNVVFSFSYSYDRPYKGRNPYSMGSTLTALDSTRWFKRDWNSYEESCTLGVQVPLTFDDRTFAGFFMAYDFRDGNVDYYRLVLRRIFHCFELTLTAGLEYDDDGNSDKEWETEFSVAFRFTGLDTPIMQHSNGVLASAFTFGNGGGL